MACSKPNRTPLYLRVRVVVLAELPRTRETLVLRMLGADRLFEEALADLSALPSDAWESCVVGPLVIHFRLASHRTPGTKEYDVSAETQAWFEDYIRKLRAKEAARNLLAVLSARGVAVPDAARKRIRAERNPARLERWIKKAVVVASLADVLDESG